MATTTRQAARAALSYRPQEAQPLIEDHAMIGDLHTAALISKDGSINFLCLPEYDSNTCFAALLGTSENGRWKIAPTGRVDAVKRRYRGNTLILETELETAEGAVRLIDFMPRRGGAPRVVRIVEGLRGAVTMTFELRPRFTYGLTVPIEQSATNWSEAIAGPDALYLRSSHGGAPPFETELTIRAGERVTYELAWARPYDEVPSPLDIDEAERETEAFWTEWTSRLRLPSEYPDIVMRSLITLKACTYAPNGAIVAAPTFGLPETPGGERNWDYRFTWVRDSVFTVLALLRAGLTDEADQFGTWLFDAIGGAPGQFQIMYGIRGERILTESSLDWLGGYGGARPVRIGNGAYTQFQLDVLGELAAVVFAYAKAYGKLPMRGAEAIKSAAETVANRWTENGHGIWEMRGPTRPFVASKLGAWVAIDRWVKVIEMFKLDEDKAGWEALRDEIRNEILTKGYSPERNTFTQYYGSATVDASLLLIPLSGFLPADDPRIVGTVKAIEEDLLEDGLVLRYRTGTSNDGLSGEEGVFLACSFWLVDTYKLMGRDEEARRLFERVVNLRNDVGLLAEEYLTREKRQIGNFPQAFSHLALVNSAYTLAEGHEAV
ncbi:MAG: glycoside hydrolase family 15 protein [Kofleriaceae bacterium]|nr:glycoside hydrolase family 15 protein [Kofleriaceae bacterium]